MTWWSKNNYQTHISTSHMKIPFTSQTRWKRDRARWNAMETRSRAIASLGFKTHFIFYSLCKRFPDNKMFMYKQIIKRLTNPPKEIFELTLTLHIRKTFIILFHFWSCFKLKSAETHRARWAQKQNNSQKMVTTFVTKRVMVIIFLEVKLQVMESLWPKTCFMKMFSLWDSNFFQI